MTDIVDIIVFLWVFSEINFFLRRRWKTSSDFGHTKAEAKRLAERKREFQDAETRVATAEREWRKLRPLVAIAKRRNDGRFDERSNAGRILNRDLPRVKKLQAQAAQQRAAAEKKLAGIASLPDRRARRWSRAASVRAGCRQGLVVLPVLLLVSGPEGGVSVGDGAISAVLIWALAVLILSLGYHAVTKRKLGL